MNKTIDISLAGILFHLDEPAYYKLKKYLEQIDHSLSTTPDKEEIINEIEARIAELFSEKISHPQQVINTHQIDEIIEIIGKPEDFDTDESENNNTTSFFKKKLFRDPENSMIGGIAAGLAHFIGIDPTLMRILFVILIFITHGGWILIYLLLWILIPKAKTTSDILKMKGEDPNLNNIVEQYTTDDESKKKVSGKLNKAESQIANILLKIIGLILVIISGIGLISLIIITVALPSWLDFLVNLQKEGLPEIGGLSFAFFNIMMLMLTGIPLLILFVLGIKILFPNSRKIGTNFYWIAGAIWILSLIFISIEGIAATSQKYTSQIYKTMAFSAPKDTLFIQKMKHNPYNDQLNIKYPIKIKLKTSKDSLIHIKIHKKIKKSPFKINKFNENSVEYKIQYDSLNHILKLPENFAYNPNSTLRKVKMILTIYIPEGLIIKLKDDFSKNLSCKKNDIIVNHHKKIKCNNKILHKDYIRISDDDSKIIINEDGIFILDKKEKTNFQMNKNGIKISKKGQLK